MIRYIATAAIAAALSATAAWSHRAALADAQVATLKNDYAKRDFRALETAHADTIRLQTAKDDAIKAAAVRQTALARDAAAVRTERDGLRDELAAARQQLPNAACPAVREYAATVNQLFGACTAELESVARQADGHASDALMLLDAWPKNISDER